MKSECTLNDLQKPLLLFAQHAHLFICSICSIVYMCKKKTFTSNKEVAYEMKCLKIREINSIYLIQVA